jgi:hypothetical protein
MEEQSQIVTQEVIEEEKGEEKVEETYLEQEAPKILLFEKKDISELKKKITDVNLDANTQKKFIYYYKNSPREYFYLAQLFIESYTCLKDHLGNEEKVKQLLESFKDINNIRDLFDEYGDGKEYGSYWAEEKIKDIIKLQIDAVRKITNLFYKLWLEENIT